MKFYLPTLKHLVIQLAKLQIYTLNLTITFWHCQKKSHYFWTGVYISFNNSLHVTRNNETKNWYGSQLYYNKRKPPCIGGIELVSLSCNRVFISAESVGRGWCKFVIATTWYQFHTTDKCGFLFMPWITDQYTFVRYTKLVNKICTAVAKVITFSIMTT